MSNFPFMSKLREFMSKLCDNYIWTEKVNYCFNPETPSKIMFIGAIRCHWLNKEEKEGERRV